jgi:hypothetical protein
MGIDLTGRQKRDQQTNFMMTKDEKERLLRFVERRMSTVSDTCRYLILKGLATEEEGD